VTAIFFRKAEHNAIVTTQNMMVW